MKLLIIEDEKDLSDSIVSYLRNEEYLCEQAFTFAEAADKISTYEYECVLLDLMLPGGNGLDLLRYIKRNSRGTGVIIISAKDSIEDKVEGLKIGADDYLSKPFHLSELSIRIFVLLRRKLFSADNVLTTGPVKIDILSRTVTVDHKKLDLTKSEFELLIFLVENRRRVVSQSAVAEHLSGDFAYMMNDFNFVYAHMKNLKAKLSAAGITGCIRTYYGTGYKWELE